MSRSIFISHATKDKELIQALVDLLENGIGVPEEEIFCSSLPGFGIPVGSNFVTYIKNEIQKPKCVIIVITPKYFASNFCISELGASWALSHKIFPIIVDPVQYSDVKDVLLGTQVAKVSDDIKLNEIRDHLLKVVKCHKKSNTKWDITRKVFMEKLPKILENQEPALTVSFEEHKVLKAQLVECQEELVSYQKELDSKDEIISQLKTLKDKSEVDEFEAEVEMVDEFEKLEAITEKIKQFRTNISWEVFKFILCEYYDQPYRINWNQDREEFDEATRVKFIDTQDEETVNWDNYKMKILLELLNQIDKFEYSEQFPGAHMENYKIPFEPNNQEFWDVHY